MNRRQNFRRQLRCKDLTAVLRHSKRRSEDRLRSRRAQTNKQSRPNDLKLGFEPRPAGRNLARVRFLVDAALPARLPFEVLHRVGDVNLIAIDSRFFQRPVENFSSRADERSTSEILLIPRLFAQEHKPRAFGSFARRRQREGPSPCAISSAAPATGGLPPQDPKR